MKKLKIALLSLFGFIFFINPLFCSEPEPKRLCVTRTIRAKILPCGCMSVAEPSQEAPFRSANSHKCPYPKIWRTKEFNIALTPTEEGKEEWYCPFDDNCNVIITTTPWISRHHNTHHHPTENQAAEALVALSNAVPTTPDDTRQGFASLREELSQNK